MCYCSVESWVLEIYELSSLAACFNIFGRSSSSLHRLFLGAITHIWMVNSLLAYGAYTNGSR